MASHMCDVVLCMVPGDLPQKKNVKQKLQGGYTPVT